MKINIIILLLSVLILFSSCNSGKREHLNQAKNIERKLDSLHVVFTAVNIADYKQLIKEMDEKCTILKDNFDIACEKHDDFVKIYGVYSGSKKMLDRAFSKKYGNINADLNYSIKQIDNLIFDIKKGNLHQDSIAIYLNQEINAINTLSVSVNAWLNNLKKQDEVNDLTSDRIDEILNSIK